ncbi:MAG: 7-cyano-7-deazaguanine synthase QueC [Planctomycetota bacterium]|nr:7-cyano-7-deazaguanine synthase QueC [Planctomycetota bacterium]
MQNPKSKIQNPAVVLLSGGIDSAVTLAVAAKTGHATFCLTVDYGQRHRCELAAARRVARSLGAEEHLVLNVDLRSIGGSALTSEIDVPKSEIPNPKSAIVSPKSKIQNPKSSVPSTYVPARNLIFLSIALAWAETLRAADIFIGANVVDYGGYPDCRPAFLRGFERLAGPATKAGSESTLRFRVRAPLLYRSKKEIVLLGARLGVDFSKTHSCYDPSPRGLACGRCDSCANRLKGFRDAGLRDPAKYVRF